MTSNVDKINELRDVCQYEMERNIAIAHCMFDTRKEYMKAISKLNKILEMKKKKQKREIKKLSKKINKIITDYNDLVNCGYFISY